MLNKYSNFLEGLSNKSNEKSNKGGDIMYITDTTDKVKDLFEKIDEMNDINKMKFLIYIFNLLNNNQINNKNELNPDMVEDDELIVFNLENIGFEHNTGDIFIQYNVMIYNGMVGNNKVYEENGNVLGLEFSDEELHLITIFESLSFEEKLDVFSEIIIKYNNETYFSNISTMMTLGNGISGFEIARLIQKFKIK